MMSNSRKINNSLFETGPHKPLVAGSNPVAATFLFN